jgi:hypothetical protein
VFTKISSQNDVCLIFCNIFVSKNYDFGTRFMIMCIKINYKQKKSSGCRSSEGHICLYYRANFHCLYELNQYLRQVSHVRRENKNPMTYFSNKKLSCSYCSTFITVIYKKLITFTDLKHLLFYIFCFINLKLYSEILCVQIL